MKNNGHCRLFIIGKQTVYNSLLIFLMGIFLLPNISSAASITGDNIIKETNKERERNGLETLSHNPLLEQAAESKAGYIFSEQVFQHNFDDRRFSSWIKDAGYVYQYVGENLAMDFATSEGVISAWLDSATHKKNLLNPEFKDIGVAVMEGMFAGKNTTVVVQIFGTPLYPYAAGKSTPAIIDPALESAPRGSIVTVPTRVEVGAKTFAIPEIKDEQNFYTVTAAAGQESFGNAGAIILSDTFVYNTSPQAVKIAADNTGQYSNIGIFPPARPYVPIWKNVMAGAEAPGSRQYSPLYIMLLASLVLVNLLAGYIHFGGTIFKNKSRLK